MVQVRQRVGHKRTFLYLEQVILKKQGAKGALSIEVFRDGMDFYFAERGKGERFINFLEDEVPIQVKKSKKLIGTDVKSNISNYKFTSLVEIAPLCKDDLLYLPKSLAKSQSSINRLVLLKNVGEVMQVVDPQTGQQGIVSGDAFWRDQFRPLVTAARSRLKRYVVLDQSPVVEDRNNAKRQTAKQRRRLAELTLMREDDMGISDQQVVARSHLGYLCKAGDVVLAYCLADTNLVDDEARASLERSGAQDIVVVRKLYGGAATGEGDAAKQRMWRLQRLDVEVAEDLKKGKAGEKEQEKIDEDEEDFLRELEADRDMRDRINLYKHEEVIKKREEAGELEADDDDDDDAADDQKLRLDELLDGLVLDQGPDEVVEQEMLEFDEDMPYGGMVGFAVEEGARARKDGIGYIDRDDRDKVEKRSVAVPVQQFGAEFMKDPKKFSFT